MVFSASLLPCVSQPFVPVGSGPRVGVGKSGVSWQKPCCSCPRLLGPAGPFPVGVPVAPLPKQALNMDAEFPSAAMALFPLQLWGW